MRKTIRRVVCGLLSAAMVFSLAACSGGNNGNAGNGGNTGGNDGTGGTDKSDVVIRVGARDWAEQYILMELMAYALEQNGFTVERVPDVGGTQLLHDAMVNGDIDLAANYSGGLYSSILGYPISYDKDEVYNTVKEEFEEKFDIVCLDQSPINNSYALFMLKSTAEEYGIETMSDLAPLTHEFVFANHGSWLEGNRERLSEVYGGDFEFREVKLFDMGLRYSSVKNGEADISTAYTTDGELYDEELYVLIEDGDIDTYEPYYVVPFVRGELLDAYPEIADIINELFVKLTEEDMIELNYQASIELEDYDVVAQTWYDANY